MSDATALAQPDDKLLVYMKLTAVSVIWGGTFVAGRYLSAGVPPLASAGLRFLLASLTLVLVLAVTRRLFVRLSVKQVIHLFWLGFFGIFTYNLCFFYGLHLISASQASLIVALNPAMIALTTFFVDRERLGLVKTGGIAACILGAATVIVSKDASVLEAAGGSRLGNLVIFGCVVSWVIYSVFSRPLVREIGPLHTVTFSVLCGTVLLLCVSIGTGDLNWGVVASLTKAQCFSLAYLGVIGSALAYIWYYDGIKRIGATQSGVFIALNPVSAVLMGVVILGEQLTPLMVVGGGLVLLGIYYCNKPTKVISLGVSRTA
ncbi:MULTISPECIES: DMT family transporter [Pseudomonas]|uniref:Permease of the drug/metabolite transporter (DMT) superfamily n=1 Tax=Pseudomonas lutea TaxID=243924 RepID=A0A9X8ME94_9PSED|nr:MULTISPECIES: EamA family transporter [Pseudomonas]SEQ84929.1 Permease of the drug/metabolite transporter (DMT) superfamily [Pseudomonas lutea]